MMLLAALIAFGAAQDASIALVAAGAPVMRPAAGEYMLDCTNTASDSPETLGHLFITFAIENGRLYRPEVINVYGGLDTMRSKFNWKGTQSGEEIKLSSIYRERGMVESVELSLKNRSERDYDLSWARTTVFNGGGQGDATVWEYAGQGTCTARENKAGSPT